jgi:ribonucleoside-diphosphate reductase subunit M2
LSSQAAAAFAAFSLDSPLKPLKLIDDAKLPESPLSLTHSPAAENDDPLSIPRKYVGDVDLPESEEPLLKESRRRFVLFPIQYHEVCV